MIAVLSDTHGRTDTRLSGPAREAVQAADLIVHAGDFTTSRVLDAFERVSTRLVAVYGNADDVSVRERLPRIATLDADCVRLVVVHGHEHGETARAMLGRQERAAIVVSGHTHRPGVVETGDVTLVNPGSHANPRGAVATHAELQPTGNGVSGRIVDAEGRTVESFDV